MSSNLSTDRMLALQKSLQEKDERLHHVSRVSRQEEKLKKDLKNLVRELAQIRKDIKDLERNRTRINEELTGMSERISSVVNEEGRQGGQLDLEVQLNDVESRNSMATRALQIQILSELQRFRNQFKTRFGKDVLNTSTTDDCC